MSLAYNKAVLLAGAHALPTFTTSYWDSLSYGDRTSSITVTTTASLGGGTISKLVDGNYSTATGACWFINGQSGKSITFDFGTPQCIDGFRWRQDIPGSHGTWIFEGSADNSTYTQIGSSFTIGNTSTAISYYVFVNATAYRYYRLSQSSGTTNASPFITEVEFRVGSTLRDPYESRDRTSIIAVTTTATIPQAGFPLTVVSNLIDGGYGASGSGITQNETATFTASESSKEIKFNFLGVAKTITGFQWSQSTTNTHGTWVFEGSNDDSSYTQLGSSFTLGGTRVQIVTFTNSTAYTYYRLRQTAGTTSGSPFLLEIEFKI